MSQLGVLVGLSRPARQCGGPGFALRRALLLMLLFGLSSLPVAEAHPTELRLEARQIMRKALAKLAQSGLSSPEISLPAARVLEALAPNELLHLASGSVMWDGFSDTEREGLRRLAVCLRYSRGWVGALDLPEQVALDAAAGKPGTSVEVFIWLVRKLEHPKLPSALEQLCEDESSVMRAVAGKVMCLLAATQGGVGSADVGWVVGRLRGLLRDPNPSVPSALILWVVDARQPLALKTLGELLKDRRPVPESTDPMLSASGKTLPPAVRNAVEGYFGLGATGLVDRPPGFSAEVLSGWLGELGRAGSPYSVRPEWIPTLDSVMTLSRGVPARAESNLGVWTVTATSLQIIATQDGPRLAYGLVLSNDKVGVLEDNEPACLIGLESGMDGTGPDVHEWRLRVVASPGPTPDELRVRVRLWRRGG